MVTHSGQMVTHYARRKVVEGKGFVGPRIKSPAVLYSPPRISRQNAACCAPRRPKSSRRDPTPQGQLSPPKPSSAMPGTTRAPALRLWPLYSPTAIDSPPHRLSNGLGGASRMNNRPASLVVAILLWLIALAQLLRVLLQVEVRASDVSIPLWVSVLAFLVLAALGTWLWRERRT